MLNNNSKLEKLMLLAADMQQLDSVQDELTRLVRECEEAELTEYELDNVAAASASPSQSIQAFMKMLSEH